MHRVNELIGKEIGSDVVNRALRDFVRGQRSTVVGAVHVTCSDESEREIAESFQHWFADALLPELKFWSKSAFRTANLGARYEWGAVRIAEEHYAIPETMASFKLLVVKLNSHVAVLKAGDRTVYGQLDRYSCESACCGALHALLAGARHPAMDELRDTFNFDGLNRLDMLLDPATVDPETRSFVAAVVNARLQSRSAIVDIQDYRPESPTVFVVLPCVSLNRKQRDTEFVVGVYWADSREGLGKAHYTGLGDDPSQYRVSHKHGLRIEDNQLQQRREARDHRQEVINEWIARNPEFQPVQDPRLSKIANEVRGTSNYTATMARETLKTLLWIAADITPVPLTILLFTKGLLGVHHLYHAHQLARGVGDAHQARDMVQEVIDQIAKMEPEKSRETIDAILAHYKA